jgi:hypothetical protein
VKGFAIFRNFRQDIVYFWYEWLSQFVSFLVIVLSSSILGVTESVLCVLLLSYSCYDWYRQHNQHLSYCWQAKYNGGHISAKELEINQDVICHLSHLIYTSSIGLISPFRKYHTRTKSSWLPAQLPNVFSLAKVSLCSVSLVLKLCLHIVDPVDRRGKSMLSRYCTLSADVDRRFRLPTPLKVNHFYSFN